MRVGCITRYREFGATNLLPTEQIADRLNGLKLKVEVRGIKVLSLFFIDEVARYRQYDADGNSVKGVYALIFEEEYRRLGKHPDYQTLFAEVDLTRAAEEVHNGYFSIDKKGWLDRHRGKQPG